MYIKNLTLHNFRGALHLERALDPQLNIFVGLNGAGKSTILDGCTIALSWLANRIRQESGSGRKITDADVNNQQSLANVVINVAYEEQTFCWNLVKQRNGKRKGMVTTSLKEVMQLVELIHRQIETPHSSHGIPLMVYYPVDRAVKDIPLRVRNKPRYHLFDAYQEALTGGASFRTFFSWFREREDLENEALRTQVKSGDEQTSGYPDPQLEAVRLALQAFMPDFKEITIRRKPLRMEVLKKDQTLTVNQLSDGEKCLMAMIGDLARRLAIANPGLDNPLTGKGIVMIDEIDLHLHPAWQRMVVPNLRSVFPNCQFLISTHSPHVITHVEPQTRHLLTWDAQKGLAITDAHESYGKTAQRVLEDLMGLDTTRPTSVQNELDRVYDAISSGALEQAKQQIGTIRLRIGADPELERAHMLIRRKELIGK